VPSIDSTITEEYKDPPETDVGSNEAREALALPASTSGVGTSQVGVFSNRSNSSSSSSSSSSSTGSSSSRSDISTLDSSDSSRSLYSLDSDSDASAADNNNEKYKYKMPSSSIIKSPVSNGSGATFEEWHSLWEVFGQVNGFNEYQSIVPHPDLPVNGHNTVKLVRTEKKALKKNKKAIASL
jgi:hypothetical protein